MNYSILGYTDWDIQTIDYSILGCIDCSYELRYYTVLRQSLMLHTNVFKANCFVAVFPQRVRLPTINSVKIPPGIDWGALCAYIMKE